MKNNWSGLIVAITSIGGWLAAPTVRADISISYNNPVTAINGTGNPDGFWNTTLSSGLNLELSLKAQTTIIGTIPTSPNDGAGTFVFPSGKKSATSSKSTWDYWFSINTDPSGLGANKLNAFDFYLTFDTPAAPGTFLTPMNVLTSFVDNAHGSNATGNWQGNHRHAGYFTYAGLE